LYASELSGKRLEILKEVIPNIARVAVLSNPNNPSKVGYWQETQSAGRALGIDVQLFDVKELNDLPAEFTGMTRNGTDALDVLSDSLFNEAQRQIIGLAAEHGLPAIYEAREFAEAGRLIFYGPNITELTRRSATLCGSAARVIPSMPSAAPGRPARPVRLPNSEVASGVITSCCKSWS
jgi:putative ABC transport system substrate-binding protein